MLLNQQANTPFSAHGFLIRRILTGEVQSILELWKILDMKFWTSISGKISKLLGSSTFYLLLIISQ